MRLAPGSRLEDLADAPSKFGHVAEYQIDPVADVMEVAQVTQQGADFRKSIG